MKKSIFIYLAGSLASILYAALNTASFSEFIQAAIGWTICVNLFIFSSFYISKHEVKEKNTNKPTENSYNRKIIYRKTFTPAGVTFRCKSDEEYSRQEVLSSCSLGDTFLLLDYLYKNAPAMIIVRRDTLLDIGTVPATLANTFIKYIDYDYDLTIKELNSFENEKGKEIYYCKMQFVVYKKEAE